MSLRVDNLRHYGLYRAVVRDNRDPKNLRRLKVQVSTTGTEVTDWVWPVISSKRPPAIGTGVYVSYLGGDPEYPVWIGEFSTEPQGVFSYGSWFSSQDQTIAAANTAYAITVNNTDFSEGISVVNASKFTVEETAIYNLQFSAQLRHRVGGGGGPGNAAIIWLRKNGSNVANSATRLNIGSGDYAVAAWNFIVDLKHDEYVQLMWAAETTNMALEYDAAASPYPAIPSVIVTMNQIA